MEEIRRLRREGVSSGRDAERAGSPAADGVEPQRGPMDTRSSPQAASDPTGSGMSRLPTIVSSGTIPHVGSTDWDR